MKNDPVGERLDKVVMEMDTFFLILCGIAGGDEENKTTFRKVGGRNYQSQRINNLGCG